MSEIKGKGFFIIEGPNGAGKTSVINYLKSKGVKTLSSPNGTPLAKMLRPAARGTAPYEDIDPLVQFLLFSASRYDEYVRLIHNKEELIVADRWWTSTYVYQCLLENFDTNFLEFTIHPKEQVQKVIILTGSHDVLVSRVNAEREKNNKHGYCRWTQDASYMEKIIRFYEKNLVDYLNKKSIPSFVLNTDKYNQEEVFGIICTEISGENHD